MKVAIITLMSAANYGNRLQNYALQETIKKLNFQPVTIINTDYYSPYIKHKSVKHIIKLMINGNYRKENRRNRKFRLFNQKFVDIDEISVTTRSRYLNDEYDYFVCGSDQVWNPTYRGDLSYEALEFVDDDNKKIAFAASFGVDNFSRSRLTENSFKRFVVALKKIKYVSVREKQGCELFFNLTGKKCNHVFDPTLLLSSDEWIKIEEKPKNFQSRKYAVLYFLGHMSKEVRNDICTKCKEMDLKLVDIYSLDDNPYSEYSPTEFIYLIRNSEIVFTDSFHGTVFSLLFKRKIKIYDHVDHYAPDVKTNSRIKSLLETFEVKCTEKENRIIYPENVNYCQLEQIRNSAICFLRGAFNNE